MLLLCARYLHFSTTLPSNVQCVTEVLLLYDCEEDRHVPSVDSRVHGCWEKWSGFIHCSNEQMSGGRWGSEVTLSPLSPLCFLSFHFSASPFSIFVYMCVRVCYWPRADLCYWLTPGAAGLPTEGGGRALMNSCTSCPLRQPLHPLLN